MLQVPELEARTVLPNTTYLKKVVDGGALLVRDSYAIEYPLEVTRTGTTYNNSVKYIPKSFRVTTAAEELTIKPEDFLDSPEFGHLFGDASHYKGMQWTSTALRNPEGAKHNEPTIKDGKPYYQRHVLEGDKIVAKDVDIPASGRVIRWNPVLGIPSETVHERPDETLYSIHGDYFHMAHKVTLPGDVVLNIGRPEFRSFEVNWRRFFMGAIYTRDDCEHRHVNDPTGGFDERESVRLVKGDTSDVEKFILKKANIN